MPRSDVDHYRGLEIWGPISLQELVRLLEPVTSGRDLRVLDVGCGRASLLVHLAAEHGAAVTGVDRSPAALRMAADDLAARMPSGNATWLAQSADDVVFDAGCFDLVIALGGPYRHDSLEETLRLYAEWTRDGGYVLYGDGFWSQPPPSAYLEATGLPVDALLTRAALVDTMSRCGLETIDHRVASRAAWDHFEDTVIENHERYAREHPEDPAIKAMIEKKRAWNDAQLRWGRDTMAFSIDLLRKAQRTLDKNA